VGEGLSMSRNDVHRPSEIVTDDYVFIGCENIKIEGFGDVQVALAERKAIQAHMERTGGTYSDHAHGGNCMVCGNANAHYTMLFHHPKTNTYVRMGQDCAEKVECFGAEAFRRLTELRDGINAERIHKAGKAKAQAVLAELGFSAAWEIFAAGYRVDNKYEECTVIDLVAKLVQYGSLSEKQQAFVASLLKRIERRPEIEAQRAAEAAAAEPVPVTKERVVIRGRILTVRDQESDYGVVTKILVRHDDGYKLWGTMPSGLRGHCARVTDTDFVDADKGAKVGDTVEFSAKIQPSPNDPKFGFFSRPTCAKIVARAEE